LASDVDRRIVVFGRGGRLEQEQRELEDGQAGGVQATDVVESPVPQAVALAPQAVLPLPLVLKSNSKISASWMTAKPARQPWEGINAAAATVAAPMLPPPVDEELRQGEPEDRQPREPRVDLLSSNTAPTKSYFMGASPNKWKTPGAVRQLGGYQSSTTATPTK